jgi:hypothetical protein
MAARVVRAIRGGRLDGRGCSGTRHAQEITSARVQFFLMLRQFEPRSKAEAAQINRGVYKRWLRADETPCD